MMRRTLLTLLSVFVSASAFATLRPIQQPESTDSLRNALNRCLRSKLSSKGFSGAILVARGNTIYLDQALGSGITPHTRFYIASISKQFAAAAIMKLAEKGRLQASDEISRYLPNVPTDKAHITIHQLLTHTSGIPQQYMADGIVEREQAIKAILAEPLKSTPGKEFRYSNDGYNLLAALIEIVSGVSYEAFLRQEVMQPAGLAETGFWGEPIQSGSPIAPTIRKIDPKPNWGFRGATGMFSTTADLYRWTRALFDYRVLSKDSTDRMMHPYVSTSSGGYGYGWFSSKTKGDLNDVWTAGYEDFGHSGIINVYDTGLVSVVLSNAGEIAGSPARDLASQEIEGILGGSRGC